MKKTAVVDALAVIFAAFCYAAALDFFLKPTGIAVGGVTGIATVLNSVFGFPVGLAVILINIPLALTALKALGAPFVAKSVVGVLAVSLATDAMPAVDLCGGDMLLCCFFGGGLLGISLGIMFTRGFSTGGSDFVIWTVKKRFPFVSTGAVYFATDAAVIGVAALVSGNVKMLLYSALTVFVSQKAIDIIMKSREKSRVLYIVSDENIKIANIICSKFGRGVTVISAKGFFSGDEKDMLMCAMPIRQVYPLVSLIKSADNKAFVVSQSADFVVGEGFEKEPKSP